MGLESLIFGKVKSMRHTEQSESLQPSSQTKRTLKERAARLTRNFLIYPKPQITLVLLSAVSTLLVFFVAAILIVQVEAHFIRLGKELQLSPDHPYFKLIGFQLNRILIYLSLGSVVGTFVSVISTLIISHRLIGPIQRTKMYFDRMAETGHIQGKLKYRQNDFFSDLSASINRAISALK
jgi:methyl-accepting chemotaxis protein